MCDRAGLPCEECMRLPADDRERLAIVRWLTQLPPDPVTGKLANVDRLAERIAGREHQARIVKP